MEIKPNTEIKNIEIKWFSGIKTIGHHIKSRFVKKSEVSEKREVNFRSIKILIFSGILIFILVTFLLPTEQEIEFTERIVQSEVTGNESEKSGSTANNQSMATQMWNSNSVGSIRSTGAGSGHQINHNTSMIVGAKNGNAKTQLRAGSRVPLRILDKFIVSQESVPILAESILDTITDSGLKLPAGTRFYGEASFQKGSERASVSFRQASLPGGEILALNGMALGKDGQPGVLGQVSSDGTKNMMGSLITTFVAGYASGSMETDIMGNSKGGIENGLKSAVATTAKDRANSYGEKLKTQREWIEVTAGTECDAILNEAINLQKSGGEE